MADRRNGSLCHVVELHNFEDNVTDLQWYGMDWGAPTPSRKDTDTERLNRIDPLQQSELFGIDIYLSCLETIQPFYL